jgi:patatin-like phospholipase domain-containing protein 2
MKFTFSFAGCGFLGIYHIGVIKAFRDHVPNILNTYIAGSSAGSFAATAAICNIEIGIFYNNSFLFHKFSMSIN